MDEDEVPEPFLCPITHEVMGVPVLAPDGRTYERAAIEQWCERHPESPLTREPFETPVRLVVNYGLRDAIEAWRAEQRLAIDPTQLSFSDPVELIGEGSFGMVIGGTLACGRHRTLVAVKKLPALAATSAAAQFDRELKVHLTAQREVIFLAQPLAGH